MSAFRGILTGFGMAAIKNKEAKDNAKMEVVKAAGLDYVTNQLPEHKKREANRASAYKQLAKILDSEEAVDFLDSNDFLVGDGKDVERTLKMLENKKIKPDAFKNYIPTSNYSDRYNQRQTDFNSRFSDVTKNFNIQGSGIGPSVVKGLLTQEEGDMTRTEEVTTPAVEPKDMGPAEKGFMTEGTPERTETITTEIPRTTADSPMSEFFITKSGTINIGDESKIAAAAASKRGFGEGIERDATGQVIGFNMDGNKNIEYNAFKAVMNDVSSKFVDKKGVVSLSLAVEEADAVLYNQTQGTIKNEIVSGYEAQKITDQSKENKGSNTFTSSGFKDSFNTRFPSDQNKKDALKNHMDSLGTKAEAQYFARSFPVDVVFSDESNVRQYLLIITR